MGLHVTVGTDAADPRAARTFQIERVEATRYHRRILVDGSEGCLGPIDYDVVCRFSQSPSIGLLGTQHVRCWNEQVRSLTGRMVRTRYRVLHPARLGRTPPTTATTRHDTAVSCPRLVGGDTLQGHNLRINDERYW